MNIEQIEFELKRLKSKQNNLDIDLSLICDRVEELKTKPDVDPIGCYRVNPTDGVHFLFVSDTGRMIQSEWVNAHDQLKLLSTGNCYPLKMRTHIKNAIECREALFKDENVVLGHECEYAKKYTSISILHINKRWILQCFSDYKLRSKYNWLNYVDTEMFIEKWHDKLISMWFLGWLG